MRTSVYVRCHHTGFAATLQLPKRVNLPKLSGENRLLAVSFLPKKDERSRKSQKTAAARPDSRLRFMHVVSSYSSCRR